MNLLRTCLLVIASIALLPGCLHYVFDDQCPAYKPGYELTDKVMADINAGKPLWDGMDYPAGWHHSAWVDRRWPVCTSTATNARAFGAHYRADGSEISRFERRYAIELRDGKWEIFPIRMTPSSQNSSASQQQN